MIAFILKVLEPILGFIFKAIDDRNAMKKKYNELIGSFQGKINATYSDEEKEAWRKIDEKQKN